jgi:hypothetical protein
MQPLYLHVDTVSVQPAQGVVLALIIALALVTGYILGRWAE